MAKKENPTLTKLPIGSISPDGWLLKELALINGLQKRLGNVSGLMENGSWVKGEALPRYVRGLVLLYGVLGDKILLDKAENYLAPILTGAKAGGDFGLQEKIFSTAKIEAVKAIFSYYETTGDENALAVLRKFFKSQFNTFSVTPYFFHARARLLEEIPAIDAVFKATDAEWLHDLTPNKCCVLIRVVALGVLNDHITAPLGKVGDEVRVTDNVFHNGVGISMGFEEDQAACRCETFGRVYQIISCGITNKSNVIYSYVGYVCGEIIGGDSGPINRAEAEQRCVREV